MEFLRVVGPDSLINQFVINLKDNTDINIVNDLQKRIFNELTGKNKASPSMSPCLSPISAICFNTYQKYSPNATV